MRWFVQPILCAVLAICLVALPSPDQDSLPDQPPGTSLLICVTDTGIGMSKEIRSRLFEPFFTTKAAGKGTGLGLAAVYGAICSHGGSVTVSSEPGQGSTFRILLPTATDDGVTKAKEPADTIEPSCGHILLVDDEDVVRDATQEMLEALGYQVTACSRGQEAIDVFSSNRGHICLVILDLVMPQLGGPETFEALRQVDPQARVLLVSGFSLNDTANRLLAAGAVGFLQKPFQLSELSQQVKQASGSADRFRPARGS